MKRIKFRPTSLVMFLLVLTLAMVAFRPGQRQHASCPLPEDSSLVVQNMVVKMYPRDRDSTIYWLKLVAKHMRGKTQKVSGDSIVFTVDRDSLDRALHFVGKLGEIKKTKTRKADITAKYNEICQQLEPLLDKKAELTKELLAAKFHKDAAAAQKKIVVVDADIMPLKKQKQIMETLVKYPKVVVLMKEKRKWFGR